MKYLSTRDSSHGIGFCEAVRRGLATDGGLYFPERVPQLSEAFFSKLPELTLPEIGMSVLLPFVEEEIEEKVLSTVLNEALDFPTPLREIRDGIYALELFHGPTLAFKDVGARFMGHVLPYCLDDDKREILVLVATSGDTGSAVAHGFYKVPGVKVVVLYPYGKVSSLQELQMASLGENIHTIAVEGTFDDCQKLVKQSFLDKDLNTQLHLTSANSINIARWLPQSLYYYLAMKVSSAPVIAVPSGNLGNLTSGLLAKKMGMPASHFIAACNANDTVPQYFFSGQYIPKPSVVTVANAMDVGDPSNFERLLALYEGKHARILEDVSAVSFSDEQILNTIRTCYDDNGYILDPHGATAYRALVARGGEGVFLATAHPAKFGAIYERLSIKVDLPEALRQLSGRTLLSTQMPADGEVLKEYLLNGSR